MSLRVLMALALLMNAIATTVVAAPDMAPETGNHADLHDSGLAHPPLVADGHSAADAADCCAHPGCDCGCAASQVAVLAFESGEPAWNRRLPGFAFFDPTPALDFVAAPFRPPA